LPLSTDSAGHH